LKRAAIEKNLREFGEETNVRGKMIGLAVAALVLAGGVYAKPARQKGQWVALFNGKDLGGWKKNGEEKWEVSRGTILCQSKANKYGYLTTEKSYKDFELKLKFKSGAKGNSGVFFHSQITGDDPQEGPAIQGMQVEVDPSVGKHTGGLYESGGRDWVVQPTPEQEKALKPGRWNDLEVSSIGNHIVTKLNGTTVADFVDPSQVFFDGAIALQIHTGGGVKMRWKDIYIKQE
jgi:3-keto-disaccharide hydrolase